MTKHSPFPQDNEIYIIWHKAIIYEALDELNSGEIGFVKSISHKLIECVPLTQTQANKLEDIYTEHTS